MGKISSHLRLSSHSTSAVSVHDHFSHESCSRVGRTSAHGEETDRYRQCTHGFESPSPILTKSLSEFVCTLCLPGKVLIPAQETLFTTSPRSPQSYTSARSLLRRSNSHHIRTPASRISCHHHQPYRHPTSIPKRPQLCYSMLSCSAPCRNSLHFMLMLFEEAHNGST